MLYLPTEQELEELLNKEREFIEDNKKLSKQD